jgi:hypothetical protein
MGARGSTANSVGYYDLGRYDDDEDDYKQWVVNNYTELTDNFGEDEAAWKKQYEKYPDMSIIWREESEEESGQQQSGQRPSGGKKPIEDLTEWTSKNDYVKGRIKPSTPKGGRACDCTSRQKVKSKIDKLESIKIFIKKILVNGEHGVTMFIVDNFDAFRYDANLKPCLWQVAFEFKQIAGMSQPAICLYVDMNADRTDQRTTQYPFETNPHVMRVINTAFLDAVRFNSNFKVSNVLNIVGNPNIANSYNIDIFLAEGMLNNGPRYKFRDLIGIEKNITMDNDQIVKMWDRLYEICKVYDDYAVQPDNDTMKDRLKKLSKEITDIYMNGVKIVNANGTQVNGNRSIVLDKDHNFTKNFNTDGWILGRADKLVAGEDRNTKKKQGENDEAHKARLEQETIAEYKSLYDKAVYNNVQRLFDDDLKIRDAWNAIFLIHYEVNGFDKCSSIKEGFGPKKGSSITNMLGCIVVALIAAIAFTFLFIWAIGSGSRMKQTNEKSSQENAEGTEQKTDVNYINDEI